MERLHWTSMVWRSHDLIRESTTTCKINFHSRLGAITVNQSFPISPAAAVAAAVEVVEVVGVQWMRGQHDSATDMSMRSHHTGLGYCCNNWDAACQAYADSFCN